jgi:hypothetical protein
LGIFSSVIPSSSAAYAIITASFQSPLIITSANAFNAYARFLKVAGNIISTMYKIAESSIYNSPKIIRTSITLSTVETTGFLNYFPAKYLPAYKAAKCPNKRRFTRPQPAIY